MPVPRFLWVQVNGLYLCTGPSPSGVASSKTDIYSALRQRSLLLPVNEARSCCGFEDAQLSLMCFLGEN